MPRPLLTYLEEKEDGFDNEDYDTYPFFANMLRDKLSFQGFNGIIEDIDSYPALKEAIARFQKMASAEVDWYLCKNGFSMNVILGIKRIRLPESDLSSNINISIRFKNGEIQKNIASRKSDWLTVARN